MDRILLLVFLALFLILASTRKWKLFFGLCIGSAMLALILLFGTFRDTDRENASRLDMKTIHILYSEDKKSLIQNTAFQDLIKRAFGLVVIGEKYSPGDISGKDPEAVDGLWWAGPFPPSIPKDAPAEAVFSSTDLFSTPLVLYSWPDIARILVEEGIAENRDGVHLITDFPRLIRMMKEGRPWATLGLRNRDGNVVIRTADPAGDIVGLLSACLIANTLHGGFPEGEKEPDEAMEELRELYERMGPLPDSEEALFSRFLKEGEWAFPLALATESRFISFYRSFPAYREKMESRIRVLYPEPTLNIPHPFVALTPKGERFFEALKSPEVQQFLSSHHGYRFRSEPSQALEFFKQPRLDHFLSPPSKSRIEQIEEGFGSFSTPAAK